MPPIPVLRSPCDRRCALHSQAASRHSLRFGEEGAAASRASRADADGELDQIVVVAFGG